VYGGDVDSSAAAMSVCQCIECTSLFLLLLLFCDGSRDCRDSLLVVGGALVVNSSVMTSCLSVCLSVCPSVSRHCTKYVAGACCCLVVDDCETGRLYRRSWFCDAVMYVVCLVIVSDATVIVVRRGYICTSVRLATVTSGLASVTLLQ